MEEITAKISGVVFSNRSTGFFVLKTVPEGRSDQLTVRGSFPGVPVGVGLRAKFLGKFEDHPTYGRQLSASSPQALRLGACGVYRDRRLHRLRRWRDVGRETALRTRPVD